MKKLPPELLDAPVSGVGLSPGTLSDQLGDDLTLLVFLRHFGCMFCRETVSDLRAVVEKDPKFPNVLFFSQGSAMESRAFLRRYWPAARAVADPRLEIYDLFGIGQTGLLGAFGPRVLAAGARTRSRGFSKGPSSGDIWRLPGLFAVTRDQIVWAYKAAHAADHPEIADIPSLIAMERE